LATPSYTTGLTGLLLEMPSTSGWTALGGGAGALNAPETDVFIQGANCIDKGYWSSAIKGMIYNMGSDQAIPADNALYIWFQYTAPPSLDTEANGGIRVIIGSGTGDYNYWYVKGKDTYTYGGWFCAVVDPTITPDSAVGSPTGAHQYFGGVANLPGDGPSKGYPWCIDAFRYGRDFYIGNGEDGDEATFAGAAATNDLSGNRYGQFQAIDGGYLMQCRLVIGTATSAVYFEDANTQVIIANTKRVCADFNKLEVNNASSYVSWTAISFLALGTVSRGDFEAVDDADINIDSCTFTDMGTFLFKSNSAIDNTTFRRCGQVTQNSAEFGGCIFANSYAAIALCANDPSKLTDCSWTSTGTGHGIEFTTTGEYTFNGNSFSNYGADETTDAAIYNNSGGLITLNIGGGGDGSPTVRNGSGASTVLCAGLVTLTLTNVFSGSDVRIFDQAGPPPNILASADPFTAAGSTGNFEYSYTYSPDTYVDVVIHKEDKQWYFINDYLLGNADASIPISQLTDRQYTNP